MKEYTIIFIGKSGAGKGTQIQKLTEFLHTKGETSIEYVGSGQGIRDFIEQDTYTSKRSYQMNQEGKLYPTFLAIWAWADRLIKSFSGQKFLFVDGAPRKVSEARIIDETFDFYDRKNRFVILLDVSDDWARDRLMQRGRGDDLNTDSVKTRLNWFHENTPDILEFFKQTGKYQICTIDAEQTIEDVQKDIMHTLEL